VHEFETIENAILTRLNPLLSQGLSALAAHSGPMDAEVLAQKTTAWPCAYVAVSAINAEVRNQVDMADMALSMIFGQRNLWGNGYAMRGDNTLAGLYDLIEGARDLLHRWPPMAGWDILRVETEQPWAALADRGVLFYEDIYKIETVTKLGG